MAERRDRKNSKNPRETAASKMTSARSPRVPMRFLLRDVAEGGSYVEREGDLSLGPSTGKGKYPRTARRRAAVPAAGVRRRFARRVRSSAVMDRATTSDFHVGRRARRGERLAIAKYLDEVTR